MGGRRLLPTATSTSSEGRSGRRKQLELGVLAAGGVAVQLERAQVTDVAEQKGEEDKANTRVNYGCGEVAAGGCSGKPWRVQGRTASEG
jgi:hypothetical protein